MKVGDKIIAVVDGSLKLYRKWDKFTVLNSYVNSFGDHMITVSENGQNFYAANFKQVITTQPLPT